MVGCNEIKYKDSHGKVCYKQLENADILDFAHSNFDKKQAFKDMERISEIKK